ncbi:unnamed protein product [Prunus armeniaca]|nr:hypothetical protein GBA52_024503 [Prunus armeniaca]
MDNIISPKRLIRIASKWQKRDAMGRNKNSSPRAAINNMLNNMVGEKGTFVIYTIDESRFVLPLSYLSNCIFLSSRCLKKSLASQVVVGQLSSHVTRSS